MYLLVLIGALNRYYSSRVLYLHIFFYIYTIIAGGSCIPYIGSCEYVLFIHLVFIFGVGSTLYSFISGRISWLAGGRCNMVGFGGLIGLLVVGIVWNGSIFSLSSWWAYIDIVEYSILMLILFWASGRHIARRATLTIFSHNIYIYFVFIIISTGGLLRRYDIIHIWQYWGGYILWTFIYFLLIYLASYCRAQYRYYYRFIGGGGGWGRCGSGSGCRKRNRDP